MITGTNGGGEGEGDGALYTSASTGLTECSGKADCAGLGATDTTGEGMSEKATGGFTAGDAEQDFAGELTPLSCLMDSAGLEIGASECSDFTGFAGGGGGEAGGV